MKKLNLALFTLGFGVAFSATLVAAERRFHAWTCYGTSSLMDADHLLGNSTSDAQLLCPLVTDAAFPSASTVTIDGDDNSGDRYVSAWRRVSFRGTNGGAVALGVFSSSATGVAQEAPIVPTWSGRFSMNVPAAFPGSATYPNDYHYVFVRVGQGCGLTGYRMNYP
jgi:hypothetical protein